MIDLRDQFAMAAMPALIMMGRTEDKVAELAYKQADAMIAEREKGSVDSVYSTKQELIKVIKEQHGLDVSNLHFLTTGHLIFILRTGRITAG
ncbi:MAG: hypothetical protein ACK4GA_05960 [Acinetobacter sp.]|uniref:hypothetical protein n=1 Tax=Acinetobacter sp. TaxID=472 RepID=UPI00391CD590